MRVAISGAILNLTAVYDKETGEIEGIYYMGRDVSADPVSQLLEESYGSTLRYKFSQRDYFVLPEAPSATQGR